MNRTTAGSQRRRSVDRNRCGSAADSLPGAWARMPTARSKYPLGNRYQRFEALVGVDDEKEGAGSVVFQVVVDGAQGLR